MNTLVVVANLGHLKAYRLVRTPARGLKLEPLDELNFPEAHGHYADKVTDIAGRFPVSESAGPYVQMSSAEALRAQNETHRRLARLVAEQIEAILRRERPEWWRFAATSEIFHAIADQIPPDLRSRMVQSVHADLTKLPPEEVAAHFLPAQKPG